MIKQTPDINMRLLQEIARTYDERGRSHNKYAS